MSETKINYHLSPLYERLGIHTVVAAEIYDVDNTRALTDTQIQYLQNVVAETLKLDEQALANNPILAGYRNTVAKISRSAKKFPPSAQALISIVQRTKRLPDINPIVNLYNSVALQVFLSLGVHDMDKLGKHIYFRFSDGNEPFFPIGGGEKTTQSGDYVYADESQVLAWLDARDSELVKVTEESKNLVIIAQGHEGSSVAYRQQALSQVCELITQHCGGSYQVFAINPEA